MRNHSPEAIRASLITQLVKNLPEMWETWVRSLGWEDPLEKGKATHYSILENSTDCIVHGVSKSRTRLSDFPFLASQVVQMVKNLPAMQETRVRSLGQEDPLEKGMATQSSMY